MKTCTDCHVENWNTDTVVLCPLHAALGASRVERAPKSQCPLCGAFLKLPAAKCSRCGAEFDQPKDATMKTCENCHSGLLDATAPVILCPLHAAAQDMRALLERVVASFEECTKVDGVNCRHYDCQTKREARALLQSLPGAP